MPITKSYAAVVEKIVPGRHGVYTVARTEDMGVVTFALNGEVWGEKHPPEPGDHVVLSHVVAHASKKRTVWRAREARAVKPSDKQ